MIEDPASGDSPSTAEGDLPRPVVELRSVSRHYRGRVETVEAVTDVNLTLRPGALVALAGPSGSGKTTLVNLVVGWERPDEGQVIRRRGSSWTDVAIVPQGLGLLEDLTIGENVEMPLRLGARSSTTASAVMEQLGIADLADRFPDEVSLGEQQRTSIARALVCRSELLVGDEPTAHQDEDNADLVFSLLERAARLGSAVLVATHEHRFLDRADEIARMDDGQIQVIHRGSAP